MQRICSNDMNVEIGKLVYTGILNENGGMETDCTITRIDNDEYLLITSTAQATRDFDLLNKYLLKYTEQSGNREHVVVVDVTSSYAVFSLMGPKSRELLSKLSTINFSNESFPFGTSKIIDLGQATIRASRITYVGELGWELYIPTEMASYCYDIIMNTGKEFNIKNAGYYAIDSLRMEKGYRAWGADLSSDWTPYECGIGFAVKLKKNENFIGKQALLNIKNKNELNKQQLICFSINNSKAFPWGGESIIYNNQTIGYVTSAAYGHTINKGIVFAMIKNIDCISLCQSISNNKLNNNSIHYTLQIDINGELYDITPSLKPLYDPNGERIKS